MSHWIVKVEDELACLSLNTGKKGNRLTPETFSELNEVLKALDFSVVRGLILESALDDFSQGFDLSFMLASDGSDPSFLQNIFATCNEALDRLYNLPIPSISMVKGSCIGGGLLMAMATDFRVADEDAKFGFPEVKQSLVVNLGLKRVYQLIGECRTKELVLLGNPIAAKVMKDWGVINWLVNGSFDENIQFFKDYIGSMPPLALRANKDLIQKLSKFTLEESIEYENKLQMDVVKSADFKEAISSFLQKRKPVYKGE
jgi:enoyl-CoA hydratase/carnithine racemase